MKTSFYDGIMERLGAGGEVLEAGGWGVDIKLPGPPMPESLSRDRENRELDIKTPVPKLQPPVPSPPFTV
jgi:hypothetical protein